MTNAQITAVLFGLGYRIVIVPKGTPLTSGQIFPFDMKELRRPDGNNGSNGSTYDNYSADSFSDEEIYANIEIDANFCQREIWPFIKRLPFSERRKFFAILNDVIWNIEGTGESNLRIDWPDALLFLTTELLCEAIQTYFDSTNK